MDDRNNKSVILIILGIVLVVLGVGITILVIKKPFKSKGSDTSETTKVIRLDVSDEGESESVSTSEEENGGTVPDSNKDNKEKEKTSEKTKVTAKENKQTTTSEKASEAKKEEEIPAIIIEKPNDTTPANQPKPAEIKDDDVIELPFVPYEEIKEN